MRLNLDGVLCRSPLQIWLKASNAFINGWILTTLAIIWKQQYSSNLETKKSRTRSIFIDSHHIESVDDVKHLRTRLESQINFKKKHFDLVSKKLSKLLGLRKFKLCHYKTYIEAFISYALIFYGSTSSSNLHTIFLLQNKILRVIFGKPAFAHSSGLLERAIFQTIHDRYASALVRFFLENFSSFTYSTTQKSTRSTSEFFFEHKTFKTQVEKFSVEHRAVKMFNNLKKSGVWSDDLVTSDRTAKNKTFHCLMNNFAIGNANSIDFF